MKGIITRVFLLLFSVSLLVFACKKTEVIERKEPGTNVFNPFDTLPPGDTGTAAVPVDSFSIIGLHQNIFRYGCAQGGCHDGVFEPDYRTVQSTFSTLVYAPVVKNNAAGDFTYRVVPYDTALSVLYERLTNCCFVNVGDRMPQDSLGQLPDWKIAAIAKWIMNGAPDMFGNIPSLPNQQPSTFGYLAFQNDTTGLRLDTARNSFTDPFEVPLGSTLQLWFGLVDNGNDFLAPATFTYNKANFTRSLDGFNPANEVPLSTLLIPWIGPLPLGQPGLAPYFRYITIDTGPGGYNFQTGDVVYFKILVQDADHSFPTEIFGIDAPIYLKMFFSFKIIP